MNAIALTTSSKMKVFIFKLFHIQGFPLPQPALGLYTTLKSHQDQIITTAATVQWTPKLRGMHITPYTAQWGKSKCHYPQFIKESLRLRGCLGSHS